ncbi:MAG: AmmeMemoRadiSam system radical SAM enzyme [Calditerrivibrio sp.]|nr:AmmeMemoRadiSam system radical SAM enzyme [Calditerrivibrio sp.]
MKEASFYEKIDSNRVRCHLCPHRCTIPDGKSGACLIRRNIDGVLYQTSYAEVTSINIDPIEKKPLYHFYPGSKILSIGTNGCNLSCAFCQNWTISKNITFREKITSEALLSIAKENASIGIAYTYNEPTIWFEYVHDTAKLFRQAGLKNVIVSNGFINSEPLATLVDYLDAANIDLKAFSEEGYRKLGGGLKEVLYTIEYLYRHDVHLEITHLAVERYTSTETEFKEMCRWLSGIDRSIPLHISRYFPSYKLNLPPTDMEYLKELFNIAKGYLHYVYLGNVSANNDTFCPYCGMRLIGRNGYRISLFIEDNVCPSCKKSLPIYL